MRHASTAFHMMAVGLLLAGAPGGCSRGKPGQGGAGSEPAQGTELGQVGGGKFVMVQLKPSQGELGPALRQELSKARAKGLRPYVYVGATWCAPCNKLRASLGNPKMVEAFTGAYVMHLDLDAWDKALPKAGFNVVGVPVFFRLHHDGRPTGETIDGGAWDEDTPENMARALRPFLAR